MRNHHSQFMMMGFKCFIAHDEDAECPEWDSEAWLGRLETRNYRIGRKGWEKHEANPYIPWGEGPWNFENCSWDDLGARVDTEQELKQAWEEERKTDMEVFAVKLLDYGSNGARLRFCDDAKADGYVFVKVPYSCDLERLNHLDFNADRCATIIVDQWNTYLEGDVHMAAVENSDGDTLECCGGFYGEESAREWIEETTKYFSGQTWVAKLLVTPGHIPESVPAEVVSNVIVVNVPMSVGKGSVAKWYASQHSETKFLAISLVEEK